jgi:NAD+ synthetase
MFSEIKDYKAVFETLVTKTADYLIKNNIKAQILGISGGIDSTVVASICYEVSILTGVPLIGRSLPTKYNKKGETTTADLVGKAFCNDFQTFNIGNMYENVLDELVETSNEQTPIANGNIQARLRMIYLYNLASIYKGIVMDTDNLTENNLGYFTIHGDVGDFNPIGGLWKTEVFKLAEFLVEKYSIQSHFFETYDIQKSDHSDYARCDAVAKSLKLKPTAGLGITNDDLEELGADSYEQVDAILQEIIAWKWYMERYKIYMPDTLQEQKEKFLNDQKLLTIPFNIVKNVTEKHFKSDFKRKQLPIKIPRETIV